MGATEEILAALAKVPREDAMKATDAAKTEAITISKRGQSLHDKDPRGNGPMQALEAYLEALDLDPSCVAAYEGVAKVVLGRASDNQPCVEAAVKFLEVGIKRSPNETSLKEHQQRLRLLLPQEQKDRNLARTASGRAPTTGGPPKKGNPAAFPARRCQYCQSPIPAGSPQCTSCQMSGETPVRADPDAPAPSSKKGLVIFIVLAVLAGGIATAAYFVHAKQSHEQAPPK